MKEWVWSAIPIYRQLTYPWYIEVPDFLRPVMQTSRVEEETPWDLLPPEIKEYILDLRAGQLHRERLKDVRHTFWIKNPFGSYSEAW